MRQVRFLFLLLIVSTPLMVTGQDPQFSQFYAAPTYLNPAMVGGSQQARVGMNYRNQWPALEANFISATAFFDFFIDQKNSGVGLLISTDKEGLAGLRSNSVALQYAYQLYLNDWLTFRPGLQIGIINRDFNFNRLTFGDQYDPNTGDFINPSTAEQFNLGMSKTFLSLAAGGVLYTKNAWFGVAAHHLNTPNQSIFEGEVAELPRKFSFHGGYKFSLRPGVVGSGMYARESERSISPTFQYKTQGQFDQLDLGMYFTAEPIIIGTWYRGLPVKKLNDLPNHESIVLLVGFTKKGSWGKQGNDYLNIGYSYDITISRLGPGSGGAHEFSITYAWPTKDPRRPPKNVMQIPCPDF
jgi:type IX secretion system PorP/SprF family membrane protein